MANHLDNFENSIKDSLSQFEVEFNPDHWAEMNTMLDSKQANINLHAEKWAVAAILLSIIALAIHFSSPDTIKKECRDILSEKQCDKNTVHKTEKKNSIIYNKVEEKTEIQQPEISTDIETKIDLTTNNKAEEIDLPNTPKNNTPKSGDVVLSDDSNQKDNHKELSSNQSPPKIDLSIDSEKNTYCLNEEVILKTTSNENISWNFGDGYITNNKKASHKYEYPGTYVIELTDDKGNNTTKTITINPIPELYFDIEAPDPMDIDQEYICTNESFNYKNITWIYNGKQIKNNDEFRPSIYHKGNHEITLVGENNFGCQNTLKKQIPLGSDYNLESASAITKNGPQDMSCWIPKALKNSTDFEINIYNRSGKLVFRTNSINNKWCGKDLNGEELNSNETYVWIASFINNKGEKQTVRGSITITQ